MEVLLAILLILVLLIIVFSRSSEKIVIDGIRYRLYKWKKTAKVLSNKYSGDIVIPDSISSLSDGNTYHVTRIGSRAFQNCTGLTSLTISKSVTSISRAAFQNCNGLISFQVNRDNPVYDSRDNCNAIIETKTNKLIIGCINTFIPESLASIANSAFEGCGNLRDLYCYAVIPPMASKEAFGYRYKNICPFITLHVPASSLESYKALDPWDKFKAIVPMKEQSDMNISGNSESASLVSDSPNIDLSKIDKRDDYLLATLKAGKSIFRYIPEDIGEILYCDTNNTKAEADTEEVIRRKLFFSNSIPLLIILCSWYVFGISPISAFMITIFMLFIMFVCIYMSLTFFGTDYFVGAEGAAEVEFNKTRENFKLEKKIFFRDIEEIITKEKRVSSGRNSRTDYIFEFYGYDEAGGCSKLDVEIKSQSNKKDHNGYYTDTVFRFGKAVEKYWTLYKLPSLKESFNRRGAIGFKVLKDDMCFNDFIIFHNDKLIIDDFVFDKSNIKNIGIKKDELVVEDMYYSPGLFGLSITGNKETVPLKSIVNSGLFLVFYNEFVSKLGFKPDVESF